MSLLIYAGAVQANVAAPVHPHIIVIVCEALTFEDIQNPACPAVTDLAEKGAIGVMRCPVIGARTGAAALLSLATGRAAEAGPEDAQAANDWELVPGDNGSTRTVFMRRFGPLDPHWDKQSSDRRQTVKYLGLADLAQRGLNDNRIGAILGRPDPPIRTAVYGNADTDIRNRSASLLTVNAAGTGEGVVALLRYYKQAPYGLVDDPLALLQSVEESEAHLIVVQLGDLARLDRAQTGLSGADLKTFRTEALRRLNIFLYGLTAGLKEQGKQADIILVAPRPPTDPRHFSAWNRLAPILASGPNFPPGLLTSETTHIPGLVANVDFAPTLLGLFNVSIPLGTTGNLMQPVAQNMPGSQRVAIIARMDFVAALNARAQTDLLLPLLAAFLLLLLLGGIRRRKASSLPGWAAWIPIALLNLPSALLLAPLLVPPTLLEYGLRIVAWLISLTLVCLLVARRLPVRPALLAIGLGFALLLGDTLAGSQLQQSALFGTASVTAMRAVYSDILVGYALFGAGLCFAGRRGSRGAVSLATEAPQDIAETPGE